MSQGPQATVFVSLLSCDDYVAAVASDERTQGFLQRRIARHRDKQDRHKRDKCDSDTDYQGSVLAKGPPESVNAFEPKTKRPEKVWLEARQHQYGA